MCQIRHWSAPDSSWNARAVRVRSPSAVNIAAGTARPVSGWRSPASAVTSASRAQAAPVRRAAASSSGRSAVVGRLRRSSPRTVSKAAVVSRNAAFGEGVTTDA
ncbi:hypothetical protein B7R87_08740 [Streptomyces tsukubensis]|uniref:Uncharacterized protein n=1 Tax=Streptomyces tsukubensis (strain DSM 42081 / NBRC 108919 / NRRL 18488 / 9993) TaxID=1114943 RepID=A0A7G3UHT2_STRT9|nr:hypothetical protein B7R87_08740 [Streptomyces tsukubensis]QKM69924.1 hypothetical protein STSU_025070 [Streptomyces tsukubensis NRRL18488]